MQQYGDEVIIARRQLRVRNSELDITQIVGIDNDNYTFSFHDTVPEFFDMVFPEVINAYANEYNLRKAPDLAKEIDPGIEEINKSYVNRVMIEFEENGVTYYALYAHLQQTDSTPVKVGDVVQAGQVIGYCGDTGNSDTAHLHYEIRVHPFTYGNDINPSPFL